MAELFEGDVLFFDTLDGGEISVENGLIECDKGFKTAVYLSLFGGNKEDDGRIKNTKTWWGNMLDTPTDEKMVSRFQNVISSLPLNSKNIKMAEDAAKDDLQWMIENGIADLIETEIIVLNKKEIVLKIKILHDGETVEDSLYSLQWGEMNGI